MIDYGLKNRTVLITGANNPLGIGAAAAVAFARLGARLVLHFFRTEGSSAPATEPGQPFYIAQQRKSCEEVMNRVVAEGAEACMFEADFGAPNAAVALFDAAEQAYGRVDVLINNAATWRGDTFVPRGAPTQNHLLDLWAHTSPLNLEAFIRIMTVNACTPALLIQEFAARHAATGGRWGRIVNISTDASYCFPSEVSYAASKFAVESLTRTGVRTRAVRNNSQCAGTRAGADRLDYLGIRASLGPANPCPPRWHARRCG